MDVLMALRRVMVVLRQGRVGSVGRDKVIKSSEGETSKYIYDGVLNLSEELQEKSIATIASLTSTLCLSLIPAWCRYIYVYSSIFLLYINKYDSCVQFIQTNCYWLEGFTGNGFNRFCVKLKKTMGSRINVLFDNIL